MPNDMQGVVVAKDRYAHCVGMMILLLSFLCLSVVKPESRQLKEEPRHWLRDAKQAILCMPELDKSLQLRFVHGGLISRRHLVQSSSG